MRWRESRFAPKSGIDPESDTRRRGREEPRAAATAAEAIAEVLPNARHRLLEGQSHNVKMRALAPVLEEHFAATALPTWA
jgi:hypothetical protein